MITLIIIIKLDCLDYIANNKLSHSFVYQTTFVVQQHTNHKGGWPLRAGFAWLEIQLFPVLRSEGCPLWKYVDTSSSFVIVHHIHIRAGEHLHDCQVHYPLIEQTPLTEDRPICTSYQEGATYNKVLQKGLQHYISTTGCDVVVTLYCMLHCCTLYYRDCQCNKGELEHSVTTTGCDDKGL